MPSLSPLTTLADSQFSEGSSGVVDSRSHRVIRRSTMERSESRTVPGTLLCAWLACKHRTHSQGTNIINQNNTITETQLADYTNTTNVTPQMKPPAL